MLDMRRLWPVGDYFVIATGTSRRQLHTIADEIDARMEALSQRRLGIEGYDSSRWILLDYGDIVIHLFDERTRAFYDLEHLWADARRVPWQNNSTRPVISDD